MPVSPLPPNGPADGVAAQVVGREREIEMILAALNTGRDLLLEGPPGTSKTTLLKAITSTWGVPLVLVEGNAELTPGRLLGHHDPSRLLREGYSEETFEPGPLVEAMQRGGFLYFEEFNRAPEDTLNTLLTAIGDRRVTVPRFGTVDALPTFRLVGSMNPYDTVGTTRLSVSIKDRLNRLVIDYQDAHAEEQIVRRRCPEIAEDKLSTRIIADAIAVTRATRSDEKILRGASVRGAIDLTLMAAELCRARGIDDTEGEGYATAFLETILLALSGRISIDHSVDTDEETVLREIWEALRRTPNRHLGDIANAIGMAKETAPGRPVDVADRANREFRVKPKALDADPNLGVGAGGAGLATVGQRQPRKAARRRPGSSTITSETGQLDTEEGESARPELIARARALAIARKFHLRDPIPRPNRPRGGQDISSVPYNGAGDDIDLDRTLDAIEDLEVPTREEIFVRERRRTRRQIVLAVDVSGSMGGARLLTAAATVGALSGRLYGDDIGVVAFWSDAAVILRLGERASLEDLVDAMVSLEAGGLTNVSFPLEFAAEELGATGDAEQRVVLLSDCVHNAGPDPRLAAARLPRVDVLFDIEGERDSEIAAQIGRSGRGQVVPVRGYADVAPALTRLFGRRD